MKGDRFTLVSRPSKPLRRTLPIPEWKPNLTYQFESYDIRNGKVVGMWVVDANHPNAEYHLSPHTFRSYTLQREKAET
jgi:hypothetical protein